MKDTIIIYYSHSGNIAFIAEKLAEKIISDTHRLETVKEYHKTGLLKYLHGGRDVTFEFKPKLKNGFVDISKYSHIILGTPIWAGKPAAPLNSFLDTVDFQNKTVSVFTSCAGGNPDKCISRLKNLIEKQGGAFNAQCSFVNPLKNKTETLDKIEMFCESITNQK